MIPRHIVAAAVLAALLATGCATQAPEPGKIIAQDRFTQLVVPDRTTRAELLAAFGETQKVQFDSGMETWLYEADAGNGRHTELVVLLDRSGIVRKVRTRPPYASDTAARPR